ncbi:MULTISPECIES: hypothetical protein [Lactobacillus]|uniref:Uncharacterized protein n=1 Tax=Lactobacillus xujianguonis TaxID=2495899 RepID=A0A437SV88_9LACO|nr:MULTISPECIES: hypothetical protein [Lactobacillus]RVU70835.1 hypothetical protein EJK17_05420 [Lactobacillus xujianguonis]RVU77066.1 hypothetical protein EJK20_01885 [Lactobacillus xujianguonis]
MSLQVSLFTAVIVLIVGLYDISVAINRRHQPQKTAVYAYAILGVIFTILGIFLIINWLLKRG